MSDTPQEDFDSSLVRLEEKLPTLVSAQNLFWKSTPQFQALLSESGVPGGVKLTSMARRFTSKDLTYLRVVRIYGEKPEKISKSLTAIVKIPGREPYTAAIHHVNTHAYIWITNFCEWFEVSSTALIKPQIHRIEISGASGEQLSKYSKDIEETIQLKSNIEDFKDKLTTEHTTAKALLADAILEKLNLESEISDLATKKESEKEEIAKLVSTYDKAHGKLQQIEIETKHLDNKYLETKNNTEQLTQKAKNLNQDIANLESQLRKLTNDRNLISDEYGPYVKEGSSQAKVYACLVTLPLFAIIFSTYQVYAGASKLLTSEYQSATDVLAAFILRIPFAAIFGLAIFYSWRLSFSMIQKIFKIHGDRLTLAKLLVVARETVHSSAKNLSISDHEKFQEQTALKIEVLKSHMARDLSEDFSYKPVPKNKTPTPEPQTPAMNDDKITKDEQPAENR